MKRKPVEEEYVPQFSECLDLNYTNPDKLDSGKPVGVCERCHTLAPTLYNGVCYDCLFGDNPVRKKHKMKWFNFFYKVGLPLNLWVGLGQLGVSFATNSYIGIILQIAHMVLTAVTWITFLRYKRMGSRNKYPLFLYEVTVSLIVYTGIANTLSFLPISPTAAIASLGGNFIGAAINLVYFSNRRFSYDIKK